MAAAALISFSCQTTGSVLGATIGELDVTFAVLDLGFAIQQGLSQQLRAADKRRRNRQNLGWHAGLRRRKFSQSGH